MTADFFDKKRWWYIALSQCLAVFIGACMCYAVKINYATPVWVGKSFYFVVSENAHVDVSTQEIRLDGGAGYLLDYEGGSYAAWSVYFDEADGLAVQAGISEPTKLIQYNVGYLYFQTRAEKRNKGVIQGALNSFYGCIDVLSQGLARLDEGMAQQACKRILRLLYKEYAYMCSVYQESYPQFSKACAAMQTALSEILTKTVYGKDLRYLLCSACDAYIRMATVFSL